MQAKNSLIAFTEYTLPTYEAADHHRRIAEKLEAVERGEIDRLMIFMPPRHGKSELATKRFSAWAMGRDLSRQIIQASYNIDLATDFGREVRNIVRSQDYLNVFGEVMSEDSKAANRWNTSSSGSYVAAGVGTAITGRGAHIAIIDDPFKDRQEADSEVTRERVWDWYKSTLYTRLMSGGAIILIQTRWHEDDLAGRILEREGDQWDVLELPAVTDEQPLWPERFPIEALDRIKHSIGQREWSALYQQSPAPDEGTYFTRDMFLMYNEGDHPPVNIYGTSDYAVTEDGGDYTEHAVWGVDHANHIWLLDGWYGQTTSAQWIDRNLDLIKKHEPLVWVGEGGVIEKSVRPYFISRAREREIYCRLEWVPSIQDKGARARSFQARAAMGMVHLPDNDYGHRALSQMLKFPAGKHDDFVDTASLIGRVLDGVVPHWEAPPPSEPNMLQKPTFDDIMDKRKRKRIHG